MRTREQESKRAREQEKEGMVLLSNPAPIVNQCGDAKSNGIKTRELRKMK